MTNCDKCGEEMYQDCQGRDRCEQCDPPCPSCDDGGGPSASRLKHFRFLGLTLMRGLGMVKVKGNLGGTYYE